MPDRPLFLNVPPGRCSIHEGGRAAYALLGEAFGLGYLEAGSPAGVPPAPWYVVNWHHRLNPSVTRANLPAGARVLGINWETEPGNPYAAGCEPGMFDVLCSPDPTIPDRPGEFYALPRPISPYRPRQSRLSHAVPRLGFHGFVTRGKHAHTLAAEINTEFSEAVLRLHLPLADHQPDARAMRRGFVAALLDNLRDGTEVELTTAYLGKSELLGWVAACDLCVYHYDRDMPGLAATPDLCVAADTPLSVSGCATFRHVHPYLRPYPEVSLREAMARRGPLARMRQDWSPDNFRAAFGRAVAALGVPLPNKEQR